MPDTEGSYFVLQFVDASSNKIADIDCCASGTAAKRYFETGTLKAAQWIIPDREIAYVTEALAARACTVQCSPSWTKANPCLISNEWRDNLR